MNTPFATFTFWSAFVVLIALFFAVSVAYYAIRKKEPEPGAIYAILFTFYSFIAYEWLANCARGLGYSI